MWCANPKPSGEKKNSFLFLFFFKSRTSYGSNQSWSDHTLTNTTRKHLAY
jgi:hypothetical protein